MKISLRRGFIVALAAAVVALVVVAACQPPGITDFPEPACAAAGNCPENPCPSSDGFESKMAEHRQDASATLANDGEDAVVAAELDRKRQVALAELEQEDPDAFAKLQSVLKDGEQVYLTTCATCHGYAADGFGPQYQLYSPRPASFKTAAVQSQSDGVIFLKAWLGNTSIEGDDIGDVPHSLPQELGATHTEFKVPSQVREKIRSQCIAGADQPQETGGMTEEELWKVVHFLRTAPSR